MVIDNIDALIFLHPQQRSCPSLSYHPFTEHLITISGSHTELERLMRL